MEVIIDVQGFKKAFNQFVLKELAITSVGPDENGEVQQQCIIFDEPFPSEALSYKYRKTNTWLTENYHGIPWDADGDHSYEDIDKVLKEILTGVIRIFVKGAEKKDWVKQLIGEANLFIEDLEDLGCPKLDDLKEKDTCWQHRHLRKSATNYHCALRNVVCLKLWYTKYLSGCMEKSLKTFCEVGNLNLMSTEEIQHLPNFFLLEFTRAGIDEAWEILPESFRRDPKIMGYRRCREHFKQTGGDQVDGPPPFVNDCPLCQLLHQ